jgi:phenol hydroxylase P4 protein
MSVIAITPDYVGEVKDRVENFHGNQLLFIGWEDHLMFCSPICIPVPASLPFRELLNIIPGVYGAHPDAARIDWNAVQWFSSGAAFSPQLDASLQDNGLGHKAVLRLRTPGLTGIAGSCS